MSTLKDVGILRQHDGGDDGIVPFTASTCSEPTLLPNSLSKISNDEAAAIASEVPQLTYLKAPWGNRKAFRHAAARGLAVTELKPKDPKAISESLTLYRSLFGS